MSCLGILVEWVRLVVSIEWVVKRASELIVDVFCVSMDCVVLDVSVDCMDVDIAVEWVVKLLSGLGYLGVSMSWEVWVFQLTKEFRRFNDLVGLGISMCWVRLGVLLYWVVWCANVQGRLGMSVGFVILDVFFCGLDDRGYLRGLGA